MLYGEVRHIAYYLQAWYNYGGKKKQDDPFSAICVKEVGDTGNMMNA